MVSGHEPLGLLRKTGRSFIEPILWLRSDSAKRRADILCPFAVPFPLAGRDVSSRLYRPVAQRQSSELSTHVLVVRFHSGLYLLAEVAKRYRAGLIDPEVAGSNPVLCSGVSDNVVIHSYSRLHLLHEVVCSRKQAWVPSWRTRIG